MRRFWKKDNPAGLPFFVSIGAGLNQIPLIREAKKLGFHVIGVDTNLNAQGFFKCDLKIQESILNHNEIYLKLRELLVDGIIRGIMTKSFGPAIRTTAFLAEKFKIPFVPYGACGAFTDKTLMKSIFQEHGIVTSRVIDSGGPRQERKIHGRRISPDFQAEYRPCEEGSKADKNSRRNEHPRKRSGQGKKLVHHRRIRPGGMK